MLDTRHKVVHQHDCFTVGRKKTTFEVSLLQTALMVTKMQLSLGCAKSSAAYEQSLSLGLRDGATDSKIYYLYSVYISLHLNEI